MFTPEPSLPGAPNASILETEPPVITEASDSGDFEFVLGRRQIASLSMVALIVIGTFTAGAYMIGKSTVPVPVSSPIASQPKQIEIVSPPAAFTSTPEQPELKAPAKVEVADSDSAIFGVPQKNQRYLQLGSVERGFAILMAHGARKEGYHAMVAAGTNPNVYRVLVGPFEGQEEYQAAKVLFTSMGFDPFTRKYDEKAETPEP